MSTVIEPVDLTEINTILGPVTDPSGQIVFSRFLGAHNFVPGPSIPKYGPISFSMFNRETALSAAPSISVSSLTANGATASWSPVVGSDHYTVQFYSGTDASMNNPIGIGNQIPSTTTSVISPTSYLFSPVRGNYYGAVLTVYYDQEETIYVRSGYSTGTLFPFPPDPTAPIIEALTESSFTVSATTLEATTYTVQMYENAVSNSFSFVDSNVKLVTPSINLSYWNGNSTVITNNFRAYPSRYYAATLTSTNLAGSTETGFSPSATLPPVVTTGVKMSALTDSLIQPTSVDTIVSWNANTYALSFSAIVLDSNNTVIASKPVAAGHINALVEFQPTPGMTYRARVLASNSYTYSTSADSSGVYYPNLPPAPRNVTLTDFNAGGGKISWLAGIPSDPRDVSGELYYTTQVYYATDASMTTGLVRVKSEETANTITTPLTGYPLVFSPISGTSGLYYAVKVSEYNIVGSNATFSASKFFPPPPSPPDPVITTLTQSNITMSWTPVGTETYQFALYSALASTDFGLENNVTTVIDYTDISSSSPYTASGLTKLTYNNRYYAIKMIASNLNGISGPSGYSPVSQPVPRIPTTVNSFEFLNPNQFEVDWNNDNYALTYTIEVYAADSAALNTISNTPSATLTVNASTYAIINFAAVPGSYYTARVSAASLGGSSSFSAYTTPGRLYPQAPSAPASAELSNLSSVGAVVTWTASPVYPNPASAYTVQMYSASNADMTIGLTPRTDQLPVPTNKYLTPQTGLELSFVPISGTVGLYYAAAVFGSNFGGLSSRRYTNSIFYPAPPEKPVASLVGMTTSNVDVSWTPLETETYTVTVSYASSSNAFFIAGGDYQSYPPVAVASTSPAYAAGSFGGENLYYSARITASNGSGKTATSDFTNVAQPAPATPTGVTMAPFNDFSIQVSSIVTWVPPLYAIGYTINIYEDTSPYLDSGGLPIVYTTTINDGGVSAAAVKFTGTGQRYYGAKVSAFNLGGTSALSAFSSNVGALNTVYIPPGPTAPSNVNIQNFFTTGNHIDVSWTAGQVFNGNTTSYYTVGMSALDTSGQVQTVYQTPSASCNIITPTLYRVNFVPNPGWAYIARVTAYNPGGSAYTDASSVYPYPPSQPTSSITSMTTTSITLSWTTTDTTPQTYQATVYQSQDSNAFFTGGTVTPALTTGNITSPATVSGIFSSGFYFAAKITATNAVGSNTSRYSSVSQPAAVSPGYVTMGSFLAGINGSESIIQWEDILDGAYYIVKIYPSNSVVADVVYTVDSTISALIASNNWVSQQYYRASVASSNLGGTTSETFSSYIQYPSPPGSFETTIASYSSSNAKLYWTDSSGALYYTVQVYDASTNSYVTQSPIGTTHISNYAAYESPASPYTVFFSPSTGHVYEMRVTSYNITSTTNSTNVPSFTYGAAPTAPTVDISSMTTTEIDLSFTALANTSYYANVYTAASATYLAAGIDVGYPLTRYLVQPTTKAIYGSFPYDGRVYAVKLYASNGIGASPLSQYSGVASPPQVAITSTILEAFTGTTTPGVITTTVSWPPISFASSYTVNLFSNSTFVYSNVTTDTAVSAVLLTFSNTNGYYPTPGSYTANVVATGPDGTTSTSPTSTAVTMPVLPNALTGVTFSTFSNLGTGNYVNVTWQIPTSSYTTTNTAISTGFLLRKNGDNFYVSGYDNGFNGILQTTDFVSYTPIGGNGINIHDFLFADNRLYGIVGTDFVQWAVDYSTFNALSPTQATYGSIAYWSNSSTFYIAKQSNVIQSYNTINGWNTFCTLPNDIYSINSVAVDSNGTVYVGVGTNIPYSCRIYSITQGNVITVFNTSSSYAASIYISPSTNTIYAGMINVSSNVFLNTFDSTGTLLTSTVLPNGGWTAGIVQKDSSSLYVLGLAGESPPYTYNLSTVNTSTVVLPNTKYVTVEIDHSGTPVSQTPPATEQLDTAVGSVDIYFPATAGYSYNAKVSVWNITGSNTTTTGTRTFPYAPTSVIPVLSNVTASNVTIGWSPSNSETTYTIFVYGSDTSKAFTQGLTSSIVTIVDSYVATTNPTTVPGSFVYDNFYYAARIASSNAAGSNTSFYSALNQVVPPIPLDVSMIDLTGGQGSLTAEIVWTPQRYATGYNIALYSDSSSVDVSAVLVSNYGITQNVSAYLATWTPEYQKYYKARVTAYSLGGNLGPSVLTSNVNYYPSLPAAPSENIIFDLFTTGNYASVTWSDPSLYPNQADYFTIQLMSIDTSFNVSPVPDQNPLPTTRVSSPQEFTFIPVGGYSYYPIVYAWNLAGSNDTSSSPVYYPKNPESTSVKIVDMTTSSINLQYPWLSYMKYDLIVNAALNVTDFATGNTGDTVFSVVDIPSGDATAITPIVPTITVLPGYIGGYTATDTPINLPGIPSPYSASFSLLTTLPYFMLEIFFDGNTGLANYLVDMGPTFTSWTTDYINYTTTYVTTEWSNSSIFTIVDTGTHILYKIGDVTLLSVTTTSHSTTRLRFLGTSIPVSLVDFLTDTVVYGPQYSDLVTIAPETIRTNNRYTTYIDNKGESFANITNSNTTSFQLLSSDASPFLDCEFSLDGGHHMTMHVSTAGISFNGGSVVNGWSNGTLFNVIDTSSHIQIKAGQTTIYNQDVSTHTTMRYLFSPLNSTNIQLFEFYPRSEYTAPPGIKNAEYTNIPNFLGDPLIYSAQLTASRRYGIPGSIVSPWSVPYQPPPSDISSITFSGIVAGSDEPIADVSWSPIMYETGVTVSIFADGASVPIQEPYVLSGAGITNALIPFPSDPSKYGTYFTAQVAATNYNSNVKRSARSSPHIYFPNLPTAPRDLTITKFFTEGQHMNVHWSTGTNGSLDDATYYTLEVRDQSENLVPAKASDGNTLLTEKKIYDYSTYINPNSTYKVYVVPTSGYTYTVKAHAFNLATFGTTIDISSIGTSKYYSGTPVSDTPTITAVTSNSITINYTKYQDTNYTIQLYQAADPASFNTGVGTIYPFSTPFALPQYTDPNRFSLGTTTPVYVRGGVYHVYPSGDFEVTYSSTSNSIATINILSNNSYYKYYTTNLFGQARDFVYGFSNLYFSYYTSNYISVATDTPVVIDDNDHSVTTLPQNNKITHLITGFGVSNGHGQYTYDNSGTTVTALYDVGDSLVVSYDGGSNFDVYQYISSCNWYELKFTKTLPATTSQNVIFFINPGLQTPASITSYSTYTLDVSTIPSDFIGTHTQTYGNNIFAVEGTHYAAKKTANKYYGINGTTISGYSVPNQIPPVINSFSSAATLKSGTQYPELDLTWSLDYDDSLTISLYTAPAANFLDGSINTSALSTTTIAQSTDVTSTTVPVTNGTYGTYITARLSASNTSSTVGLSGFTHPAVYYPYLPLPPAVYLENPTRSSFNVYWIPYHDPNTYEFNDRLGNNYTAIQSNIKTVTLGDRRSFTYTINGSNVDFHIKTTSTLAWNYSYRHVFQDSDTGFGLCLYRLSNSYFNLDYSVVRATTSNPSTADFSPTSTSTWVIGKVVVVEGVGSITVGPDFSNGLTLRYNSDNTVSFYENDTQLIAFNFGTSQTATSLPLGHAPPYRLRFVGDGTSNSTPASSVTFDTSINYSSGVSYTPPNFSDATSYTVAMRTVDPSGVDTETINANGGIVQSNVVTYTSYTQDTSGYTMAFSPTSGYSYYANVTASGLTGISTTRSSTPYTFPYAPVANQPVILGMTSTTMTVDVSYVSGIFNSIYFYESDTSASFASRGTVLQPLATYPITSSPYTITNLQLPAHFFYSVKLYLSNIAGSNMSSYATPTQPTPAAPTAVSIGTITNSNLTVNLTEGDQYAEAYIVTLYDSTDNISFESIETSNFSYGVPIIFSNTFVHGYWYTATVVASNLGGAALLASASKQYPLLPPTPNTVTVSYVQSTAQTLGWNDPGNSNGGGVFAGQPDYYTAELGQIFKTTISAGNFTLSDGGFTVNVPDEVVGGIALGMQLYGSGFTGQTIITQKTPRSYSIFPIMSATVDTGSATYGFLPITQSPVGSTDISANLSNYTFGISSVDTSYSYSVTTPSRPTSGTYYGSKITAYNGGGSVYAFSDPTMFPYAYSQPTGVTITHIDGSSIDVSWTTPNYNGLPPTFALNVYSAPTTSDFANRTANVTTLYSNIYLSNLHITGLNFNNDALFYGAKITINSVGGSNISAYSPPVNLVLPPYGPVTNVQVTSVDGSGINITWTPTANSTSYCVQGFTSAGSTQLTSSNFSNNPPFSPVNYGTILGNVTRTTLYPSTPVSGFSNTYISILVLPLNAATPVIGDFITSQALLDFYLAASTPHYVPNPPSRPIPTLNSITPTTFNFSWTLSNDVDPAAAASTEPLNAYRVAVMRNDVSTTIAGIAWLSVPSVISSLWVLSTIAPIDASGGTYTLNVSSANIRTKDSSNLEGYYYSLVLPAYNEAGNTYATSVGTSPALYWPGS